MRRSKKRLVGALLCFCILGSVTAAGEGSANIPDQPMTDAYDPDAVAPLLPEASLYLNKDRLSAEKGIIEYSFYTDEFHYNDYTLYDHKNVRVRESIAEETHWQMLNPRTVTYGRDGEPYLRSWCGVVYTGGISQTQRTEDGSYIGTLVENPGGEQGLFTVRYRSAVIDRNGKMYDLILDFDRITFVSEAEVEGPLPIMESCKLLFAPNLYEDGGYLLKTKDPSDSVKIEAQFEFRYRIETAQGELPEGLLLFSLGDGDTRREEYIDIVSGAVSSAVIPDADVSDTILIGPQGAMTAAISCDGRDYEEYPLFTSSLSVSITQMATKGGSVRYITASPQNTETAVESGAYLRVLTIGADSEHRIVPDHGYAIESIWIDNQQIPYPELRWETQRDGSSVARYTVTERYDTFRTETEYTFVRDRDGSVWVRFDDIQESHRLFVEFEKPFWLLLKRLRLQKKHWSFAAAFVSGTVCLAAVLWMRKKARRLQEN